MSKDSSSSSSSPHFFSFPTWQELRQTSPAIDEFLRRQEKEIDVPLLNAKKSFAKHYPRLRSLVEEKQPIGVCGTCLTGEKEDKSNQLTPQWLCAKKYVENIVFLLCSGAKFEKESPTQHAEFRATNLESMIAAATDHLVARVNEKTTHDIVRWLKENQNESEKVYESKLELLEQLGLAKMIPALGCVHWQWRDIFEDLILVCLYEIVDLT